MEKQEISDLLKAGKEELLTLLESISENNINKIPFKDSWTAAELADHLVKSTSSFSKLLKNKVEDTPADFPDRVENIKDVMLDFDKKFQAPEFIIPKKNNCKKDKLLITLNSLFEDLINSVSSLDLSKTCTLFEMPGVGKVTRREAVWFVIYHTQQHNHQLKNIIRILKERSDV